MELSHLAAISGSAASQAAAAPLPKPRVSAHGLDNRGLEPASSPGVGYGRFGRMFAFMGGGLPDDCLQDIATAMIKVDAGVPIDVAEAADENPIVSAGYTYFGQFVDHDITLDTTSLKQKAVDVAAMIDFRTPALDLDCVYGRGPDDQPYMYEPDGLHLRLGTQLNAPATATAIRNRHDVLRLTSAGGPVPVGKGPHPAILGDKRNDENRIVCQIQASFIAFHNKVVDDPQLIAFYGGDFGDDGSRFRTAANIVRWHYQWLVLNDYLNRVLEPTIIDEILGHGPEPSLPNYAKAEAKYAYMPVEFAGAAFRFGHSMVRPSYALNENIGADKSKTATGDEDTTQQPARLMIFTDGASPEENFNGFGFDLPLTWGIDWAFFFPDLDRSGQPALFKLPQPSYRMDAQLVHPLKSLPEFRVGGANSPFRNLAYRNLLRGDANLRLPFGEQIAHALGIEPLPPEVVWGTGSQKLFKPGPGGALVQRDEADLKGLMDEEFEEFESTDQRRAVVRDKWIKTNSLLKGHTPLWYYILREAEYYGDTRAGTKDETPYFGGQHLGPVGSRIVGETFVGMLWNDPTSYLRMRPLFKPHPKIAGANPAAFTVGALLKYALG